MTVSAPQLSIKTFLNPFELYSDARTHGYQGDTRKVRLGRVTPAGGGSIAKSDDGLRCVVTGRETLRILRVSEPSQHGNPDHKYAVGKGGHRIDASRNFWEGSGLKIDSASTDVAWGHGPFSNKILTSARNGELILWDLNKSGGTKYERRTKDHIRSIHKMSVSHVVHHYCVTGSADGHMRVWDLRDLSKSIMRVHHPTSVRSLVFSPSLWQPLQAIVGLDNGSIYRWDLKMGQRGQLDKLPVAHTASVTALDWCSASTVNSQASGQADAGGLGWIVSGGLDRCVKVWDLTAPGTPPHIPHKPTYILHPSFAIRRLAWRPGYECELAVVSNAEYAPPAAETALPSSGPPGLLTRVGSGLGLDSLMRSSNMPQSLYAAKEKLLSSPESKGPTRTTSMGDAVEIWDVRRNWLAKWSVMGSSVDGGITDITFRDSHALWTQHVNGSFSQLDLRECTKPISAIPRVAATWGPSGCLSFVVDKKEKWEVPYDDIQPERRIATELPKPPFKVLGDPPATITTQAIAHYEFDALPIDVDAFTALARGYIYEGCDRREICAHNAALAFSAGHNLAGQTWMLLGAALSQYMPTHFLPTPPQSPQRQNIGFSSPAPLPPQSLALATPAAGYSFPPSSSSGNDPSSFSNTISPAKRSTSGSLSTKLSSHMVASSSSSKLTPTPTSSASPSPRLFPTSLPPSNSRRASFFGRPDGIESGSLVNPSSMRRPSVSSPSATSPGDRSMSSLRHVGEGVLDDSDSSSSGEGGDDEGEATANANSSEQEITPPPLVSPGLTAPRAVPTPSPLSRGHQAWTEDEGDEGDYQDDSDSSHSPQSSTDSDSSSSSSPRTRSRPARAPRRTSNHFKLRSRSSTVASLAAPLPRQLLPEGSPSSIRTVTIAADNSMIERDDAYVGSGDVNDTRSGHARQKSQTVSDYNLLGFNSTRQSKAPESIVEHALVDDAHQTERAVEVVEFDDRVFKEKTLSALVTALEEFADEGDVQTCALLALVAPEELKVSKARVIRFVDAYIEILTRLRLHTCAAYLRKFSNIEDINKTTLLNTIIYTSCGKCRKPLLVPAGTQTNKTRGRGAYSYCIACNTSVVKCSICRLPVRTLLFQCSICHHGGHQACYRQYYMDQPMVDLRSPFMPGEGHVPDAQGSARIRRTFAEDDMASTASLESSALGETFIIRSPLLNSSIYAGHPCAAGCGHYCWAVNKTRNEL